MHYRVANHGHQGVATVTRCSRRRHRLSSVFAGHGAISRISSGGQGRGRTADLPLFRRSVLARPPGAVNGINAALPAERGFSMCGITLALVPTCAGKCRLIRGFLVGDLTAGPDLWDFCGEATHARTGNSGRRRGGYAEASTVPRGPRPPHPARLRRSASSRPPLSRPTPKVTTCRSPSSRKHADRRIGATKAWIAQAVDRAQIAQFWTGSPWHLGPLARARGFASSMLCRYASGAGAGRLLIARPAAVKMARWEVAKAGK